MSAKYEIVSAADTELISQTSEFATFFRHIALLCAIGQHQPPPDQPVLVRHDKILDLLLGYHGGMVSTHGQRISECVH